MPIHCIQGINQIFILKLISLWVIMGCRDGSRQKTSKAKTGTLTPDKGKVL